MASKKNRNLILGALLAVGLLAAFVLKPFTTIFGLVLILLVLGLMFYLIILGRKALGGM